MQCHHITNKYIRHHGHKGATIPGELAFIANDKNVCSETADRRKFRDHVLCLVKLLQKNLLRLDRV